MPAAVVVELLQQLLDLDSPLSESEYQVLAGRLRWTTLDASPRTIIAAGPWPTGGRIHLTLREGHVVNIRIGISNSTDHSDHAKAASDAVYHHNATDAARTLGPPTGHLGGDKPRTWWTLDHKVLDISRWGQAVILTWSTPADHAELLASLGAPA